MDSVRPHPASEGLPQAQLQPPDDPMPTLPPFRGDFAHGILAWAISLGIAFIPSFAMNIQAIIPRDPALSARENPYFLGFILSVGALMIPAVAFWVILFRKRGETLSIKWLMILWGITLLLSTWCGVELWKG